MSELIVKNPPNALIVDAVEPGSPAAQAGILPGDLLRSINGKPILDILDYHYHSTESHLRMHIERNGTPRIIRIRVPEGKSIGLTFQHELGDKIHTCNNKCVFCFIHQMPKKMRKTLYLMDDDFRLSFMHGNYITLTNVSEAEFARIVEQRLSPLYVSVHATDPILRGRLLGKKEPAPILPRLRFLHENRIDVHAQIVLCPGLNDGAALHQTLEDLAAEHPVASGRRSGVLSVAIVPVGLTQFRQRLPKLVSVDRDYARQMIASMRRRMRDFQRRLGTRFAWLSDEWYFLAGLPVPGTPHYEQFPQLEDGIGTMRLFLDNARRIYRRLPQRAPQSVSATLVTAEMPAGILTELVTWLNSIEGVDVNVCVVKNEFFGGGINVAGLLTGTDILQQLSNFPVRGTIYLPRICTREDYLLLDDYTVEDLRRESRQNIQVVGTSPRELVEAMGLLPHRNTRHTDTSRWLMEALPT
jgi:putative radical SAM enzyme (TIGR03279 family)